MQALNVIFLVYHTSIRCTVRKTGGSMIGFVDSLNIFVAGRDDGTRGEKIKERLKNMEEEAA